MECHYLFIWLFCKLFIYWIINPSSWQGLNYAWLNLRLLHSDATLLQWRIAFARHTWKLNHPPRPFCLHLKQKLRQVAARTSACYQNKGNCIYLNAWDMLWPFAGRFHLMSLCRVCTGNRTSRASFVRREEGLAIVTRIFSMNFFCRNYHLIFKEFATKSVIGSITFDIRNIRCEKWFHLFLHSILLRVSFYCFVLLLLFFRVSTTSQEWLVQNNSLISVLFLSI